MGTRQLGFSELMTMAYTRINAAIPAGESLYNHVPQNATMPYHVIGQPLGRESLMFNTRDTEAEENVIQFDSWFDEISGKGDKPCIDAMNRIVQEMTSYPIVMVGYDNSYMVFLDFANILKDDTASGKIIRHGILRFRVEMAPT